MAKFSASHSQAATGATELNALAFNSILLSATVIDNTVNLDPWFSFQGSLTFAAAPTIADTNTLDLYAVPSYDGTNYGAVDASNLPPSSLFLGSISIKSASATQQVVSAALPAPGPFKFKLAVKNSTGVNMGASAGALTAYSWQTQ